MDDYRRLTLVDDRKKQTMHSRFRQNKGHQGAWEAFTAAILEGGQEPIPYSDLMRISYAALACQESLQTGQPIDLADFIQSKSSPRSSK